VRVREEGGEKSESAKECSDRIYKGQNKGTEEENDAHTLFALAGCVKIRLKAEDKV
jgi:hypothetical protein